MYKTNRYIVLYILSFMAVCAMAENKLNIGTKAPDFTLSVVGSDTLISLSDFVNKKIVIVHFWHSR